VLFDRGAAQVEASEHVGIGTNNVAELRAAIRALVVIAQYAGPAVPAVVCTDSAYTIGAITEDWQLKKNIPMVLAARMRHAALPLVTFKHVRGHAGVYGNEVADWLAWHARKVVLAGRGIKVPERKRPLPKEQTQ
jgi:ribonuclease HI